MCAMLIDGDNAFVALYNVSEGKHGRELTLKSSCCGKDMIMKCMQ